MVEEKIIEALAEANIGPCVSVPCKFLAGLLKCLESIPERMLIYPSREEEGLGICAGAYLAGRFPIMLIQNSGLGNLVNAYCSLNQFYDIPVFFLISYRGEEAEQVAAQRPLGSISCQLLDLLKVEHHVFDRPEQAADLLKYLEQYRALRKSFAILTRPGFWKN